MESNNDFSEFEEMFGFPPEVGPTDDPEEGQDVPPVEEDDDAGQNEPAKDEPSEVDETAEQFLTFLSNYGIVDLGEGQEIKSPEDIENLLHQTRTSMYDKAADDLWNTVPENFRPIIEYALNGGRSLEDYLKVASGDAIFNADISSVQGQRAVLTEYYRQTAPHLPEAKIEKMVNLLDEQGELDGEASEALDYLKDLSQKRKQDLIQRAQYEDQQRAQQAYQQTAALVTAIDQTEFIAPARKNKVKSFFFEPIRMDNNQSTTGFNYVIGNILNNPEHQAQLADLLLDYDPDHGFDLNRFEKRVQSKATKSFQELMQSRIDPKRKAKGTIVKEKRTNFDFDKFLRT
jgi:hypothetical protein